MNGLVLRQNTAVTIPIGPVLDPDGVEYAGAVIGDFSISKNGAALVALGAPTSVTFASNGHYRLSLDASENDTLGEWRVVCTKSGYQMPPLERQVIPAPVYDSLVLGTDLLPVDVTSMANNVITSNAIALSAITAIQAGLSTLTQPDIRNAVGLSSNNLEALIDAVQAVVDSNNTEIVKIPRLGTTHKHRQVASNAVAKSADVIIEAAP